MISRARPENAGEKRLCKRFSHFSGNDEINGQGHKNYKTKRGQNFKEYWKITNRIGKIDDTLTTLQGQMDITNKELKIVKKAGIKTDQKV